MIERVFDGLFHFYRLCGAASDGARTIERDGVIAAVVPAAPERAVANGAVYRSPGALEAAYDELADAYAEIGAKWTVWVWPEDDAAARFLEERGHVLDAQPVAMAHDLGGVERPEADALPDWTADGDFAEVGPLNDRAYPFGTDSFTRALQHAPADGTHVYLARDDGQPVGCLLMTDHDGNSDVEAGRRACPRPAAAASPGTCFATRSLTPASAASRPPRWSRRRSAYPVYERLGFRPLGRASMWEFRPDA